LCILKNNIDRQSFYFQTFVKLFSRFSHHKSKNIVGGKFWQIIANKANNMEIFYCKVEIAVGNWPFSDQFQHLANVPKSVLIGHISHAFSMEQ